MAGQSVPRDPSSMADQELRENLEVFGTAVSELKRIVEGIVPGGLDPDSAEYTSIVETLIDSDDVRRLLNTMEEVIRECVFDMGVDEATLRSLIEDLRRVHPSFVAEVEKRVRGS